MNRALVTAVSALVTPAYGAPTRTSESARQQALYAAAAYLPFLGLFAEASKRRAA